MRPRLISRQTSVACCCFGRLGDTTAIASSKFLPARRCAVVSVRSSQVGFYRNVWTDRAGVCHKFHIRLSYTLYCKEIRAYSKIRILSSGTLCQTLNLADFSFFCHATSIVASVITLSRRVSTVVYNIRAWRTLSRGSSATSETCHIYNP